MIRSRQMAILGTLFVACTPTAKPNSHREPAPSDKRAPSDPPASQRCNLEVPDASAAIELAAEAKRAAGFPDAHDVSGAKTLAAEGFLLSPMFPPQWPASDCAVVFYVSETQLYLGGASHVMRNAVTARVTVRLDTGKSEVTTLEHAPSLGGSLRHGGGVLRPDRQEWVFDAVAHSTVPEFADEVMSYQNWLREEKYAAAALFVWHRAFFDFVVQEDAFLVKQAEANIRTWRGGPP